jgi:DNA-directed RNA polymerase specialized sigma24 family protein
VFNEGFNHCAKALALLPLELRRLFALSPICRRCFVLRFLAGLGPEDCSSLLKLSNQEFQMALGEALRSLAKEALAEMQPTGLR